MNAFVYAPRRVVSVTVALAAIMLHAGAANAQATTSRVSGSAGGLNRIVTFEDSRTLAGPTQAEGSGAGIDPRGGEGAATASAQAGYGYLKASAAGSATVYANSGGDAFASFADAVTINSPGRLGQTGSISWTVSFDWQLSADSSNSGSGGASVAGGLMVGQTRFSTAEHVQSSAGNQTRSLQSTLNSQSIPFTKSVTTTTSFRFGEPVSMTAQLHSIAGAGGGSYFQGNPALPGWASSSSDAGHSFYWGGFGSVDDALGNEVVYSLTSQSGTDWTQSFVPTPIPEPGTWGLMAVGAVIVLSLRRAEVTSRPRSCY